MRQLMAQMRLAPPKRTRRRTATSSTGKRLDMRSTIRRSQRTGGDPVEQVRAASTTKPRRLVLLADISGSMEPYARAYLQLLHCAAGGANAETFVFATRLTRLTRAATHPQPECRAAAGRGERAGLGGWTRARRRTEGIQRWMGPTRVGPRRGAADRLRWMGCRRPGARRRADGQTHSAGPPRRLGQPPQAEQQLPAARRRDGRRAAIRRRLRQRPFAGRHVRRARSDRRPATCGTDLPRRLAGTLVLFVDA